MARGMDVLLERDEELGRIAAALEGAHAGRGSVLVFEGVSGLGKTALLERAAAAAGEAGVDVLKATAHELEAALAFGVVRQLLEPVFDALGSEDRRVLAEGPTRPALSLLGRGRVRGGRDDLEVIHALYRFVAHLGRTRPLTLVVDDVQWADASSLRFALYLAQRVPGLPVVLLAAFRTGEPTDAPRLLDRLTAEAGAPHRLAPLSEAGSHAMVRATFPRSAGAFRRECARVTGGNPLFLRELLQAAAEAGIRPDAHGAGELAELAPDALLGSTVRRLERLPEGARALAEAVAVLEEGAPLRRAGALAGLDAVAAARAADALTGAGIMRSSSPPVFVHPLLRSAVRAALPEAERAERHRLAARLATEEGTAPGEVASHLLAASRTGDERAVRTLRDAARDALEHGAPESARRYLVRALDEPPGAAERAAVELELAEAELLVDPPAGIARLEHALAATEDTRTVVAAYARLGEVMFQAGRYDDAARAFERGLAVDPPPGDEVTLRLTAGRLAMETLRRGGTAPDAPQLTERASHRAVRLAHVHGALAAVTGCGPHEDALRHSLAALGDGAMLVEDGVALDLLVVMACVVWCDDFEVAEREIVRGLDWAERHAAPLARAELLFGRAWMRFWQGRLEEAASDAIEAIEPWRGGWNGQITYARFWGASALLAMDRMDGAAELLETPVAEENEADSVGIAAVTVARGQLATCRGDPERAWTIQRQAVERARELPFLHNPTAMPWRSIAAEAALAVDEVGEAEKLVAEELELAQAFGAARALGVAQRTAGLVRRDLELQHQACETLSRSPARLELAEAYVNLGAALPRSAPRRSARAPARGARPRVEHRCRTPPRARA